MQVGLLGGLEVRDGNGDPIELRGAKLRALLAVLSLSAGRVVPAGQIVDALWGEDPPPGVRNGLQGLVSKLRRSLGDAELIGTRGTGYALDLPPDSVDLHRFEQTVEQAHRASAAGEHEQAAELFAAADALWRGDALSEFAYDDFAGSTITRVTELRLSAMEERMECELALGHHHTAIPALEALVTDHPLRERLRGELMLALYRSGRQGDALRVYQEGRQLLADELGLDPGRELRDLESAVLAQDPSLAVQGPGRAPSSAATATADRHWNLPAALTALVGRDGDLRALAGLCAEHRLVTLVGPGGVGKTRLAIEVARAQGGLLTNGAVIVELAPVNDAAGVRDAIAVPLEARDPERLSALVGDREVLILLDNCEHVVDVAAAVVQDLLRSCPRLRLITTSREPLRVEGETVWPVAPLDHSSAVQLFLDRSAAANPGLSLGELEQVVEDICTRLDGLPLAVELAAARTRALPLTQILQRLDDRFRLLTGGSRTAQPRQQTLRAVVDWSYDLLFEEERRVFERLSVFPGGCTLDAAEAVCTDDDLDASAVADVLSALVDKSLVVAQLEGSVVRYALLQTLAEYSRDRLAERGDAADARARMAASFTALCARSDQAVRGVEQLDWFSEISVELDNLRAALDWYVEIGDTERAVHLAGSLGWFWWVTGRATEGCRWIDSALSTTGEPSAAVLARALTWLAYLGYIVGRGADKTIALGEQAHALYAGADDPHGFAYSCFQIGMVTISFGDSKHGGQLLAESVELYERLRDDEWGRAQHDLVLSYVVWLENDPHRRESLLQDAAHGFGAAGDLWGRALTLLLFGEMRGVEGADPAAARAAFEETIAIARTLGVGSIEGIALARLGNVANQDWDLALAERLHDEAIAIGRRLAYPPVIGFSLNSMAGRLRRQGRFDEAEAAAHEALELYRGAGQDRPHDDEGVHMDAPEGATLSLVLLGYVAADRMQLDLARELHARALAVARRTSDPVLIAIAIEALAKIAALQSEGAEAAMLLGQARALREQALTSYSTFEDDVVEARATALALLGRDAYDAAFEQGQGSDLGEMMSFSAYL